MGAMTAAKNRRKKNTPMPSVAAAPNLTHRANFDWTTEPKPAPIPRFLFRRRWSDGRRQEQTCKPTC